MKTFSIITTTSLVALLSSFGLMACGGSEVEPADQTQSAGLTQPAPSAATAPEAMRPEARGDHRFGPPSADKMIARFDTNKDGQLQAAELPERMQQHIADIDTSGDGIVTKDELTAHFQAKFAEHKAEFEKRAKERFDQKDVNHDGTLDQSEVGAEHWAKLSVADTNGDGKLTPDELKAAFQAGKIGPMHGDHGGHGGRWHGPDAPPSNAPAATAAPATPAPAL